jgi:hypothetical protein
MSEEKKNAIKDTEMKYQRDHEQQGSVLVPSVSICCAADRRGTSFSHSIRTLQSTRWRFSSRKTLTATSPERFC